MQAEGHRAEFSLRPDYLRSILLEIVAISPTTSGLAIIRCLREEISPPVFYSSRALSYSACGLLFNTYGQFTSSAVNFLLCCSCCALGIPDAYQTISEWRKEKWVFDFLSLVLLLLMHARSTLKSITHNSFMALLARFTSTRSMDPCVKYLRSLAFRQVSLDPGDVHDGTIKAG